MMKRFKWIKSIVILCVHFIAERNMSVMKGIVDAGDQSSKGQDIRHVHRNRLRQCGGGGDGTEMKSQLVSEG